MVAVLGISASSQSALLRQLDRLGTNLLTVTPGQTLGGDDAVLPETSTGKIGRVGPVEAASATADVDAAVYRSDRIPGAETGGIAVRAAEVDLAATLGASVARGTFLNHATARYPAVVLGSPPPSASGSTGPTAGSRSGWAACGSPWSASSTLWRSPPRSTARRSSAFRWRSRYSAPSRHRPRCTSEPTPSRSRPCARSSAPLQNPDKPEEVEVSRPSDALAARAAATTAFTSLLLGLGGVALLGAAWASPTSW